MLDNGNKIAVVLRAALLISAFAAPAYITAVAQEAVSCGRFGDAYEAQQFFLTHQSALDRDPYGLDEDGDGIACEALLMTGREVENWSTFSRIHVAVGGLVLFIAGFQFRELLGRRGVNVPSRGGKPGYNTRKMVYRDYLQTPEWAAIRERIQRRDGRKCKICGGTEELQIHHKSYDHRGREDPRDLITLCGGCHASTHGKYHPSAVAQTGSPIDFVKLSGSSDSGQVSLNASTSGPAKLSIVNLSGSNADVFRKRIALYPGRWSVTTSAVAKSPTRLAFYFMKPGARTIAE